MLLRVYGPRTFDLRSADGHFRQIVAQPIPEADETAFGTAPVDRPNGFLTDLGAPDGITPDIPVIPTAQQLAGGDDPELAAGLAALGP